jgi:heptosyltransferase-2
LESAPRRVLVKEVNWLGDIVISLPALKAIRRALPDAHLSVLVKEEFASFFDGSGWVDEVIGYRVSRGARGLVDRCSIIDGIRHRKHDLAVLFPNSFESALWAALGGVTYRAGFARDGRSLLLTHRSTPSAEVLGTHQVHYYLEMLRETLGIEGDADDYALDVHEPYRLDVRQWLAERRRRPQGRLFVLAPAAAYGPAKEWPMDRYAALIDLLDIHEGAECVLIGAPAERARCEQIAAASKSGAIVGAGEANIGEVIALLSIADGFAGNDSGCMHLAGALGIPTVGIFGSTSPARTAPLGRRSRVIYRQIECSPCLARTCRFGHYRCLTEIGAEEVARSLEQLADWPIIDELA